MTFQRVEVEQLVPNWISPLQQAPHIGVQFADSALSIAVKTEVTEVW